MKVSVITVVYNNAATIADSIESVMSQDYPDIEYIIVDGQSTDGTLDIVNKYRERISTIISEKDNGLYDAINKGIKIAKGDVIGLLHSDDLFCDEQVISKVVQTFKQNDVDSVYADLHYVDKNDPLRVVRNWKSGNYKREKFLQGWMPPHPTFYVKKSVYDTYGLYDTDFKSAADYELMLRFLFKHGISTYYIQDTLVKMRIGGESNRSFLNRLRANKEDYIAWKKNDLTPKFYIRLLKPLRKLHQFILK